MDMLIDFPGGYKVDAHFGSFEVSTDQPPSSTSPTPFDLFLSSIGTCAGIYILGFCRQRELSTDGIHIIQHNHPDPLTGLIDRIDLEIDVPPTFPAQYHEALIRSAELCKVKKSLEHPPTFDVSTRVVGSA